MGREVVWKEMELAGAACLPAAGYRFGDSDLHTPSNVNDVGFYGYYWSSSLNSGSSAYALYLSSDLVNSSYDFSRSKACSIRLVTDCK